MSNFQKTNPFLRLSKMVIHMPWNNLYTIFFIKTHTLYNTERVHVQLSRPVCHWWQLLCHRKYRSFHQNKTNTRKVIPPETVSHFHDPVIRGDQLVLQMQALLTLKTLSVRMRNEKEVEMQLNKWFFIDKWLSKSDFLCKNVSVPNFERKSLKLLTHTKKDSRNYLIVFTKKCNCFIR